MADINNLLDEAIKETENLNEDEVFLVKELFKGYIRSYVKLVEKVARMVDEKGVAVILKNNAPRYGGMLIDYYFICLERKDNIDGIKRYKTLGKKHS